jgi:hypothetical protein
MRLPKIRAPQTRVLGLRAPWRVVIPALAMLVVVIVAVVTAGSGSGRLPPPPVLASGSARSSAAQQHGAQIFTAGTGVPLTGCSLSTSQTAVAGRNGEVVTVKTAPGAWVKMQAHYSRFTSSHAGQADSGGTATFGLDDPPTVVAETVRLTATASLQKQQTSCQGAFTPRPVALGCSVWVSNPAPGPGPASELVTVRTAPGASVRVAAQYLRFTSVHRHRASNGEAYFNLFINNPTSGYPVRVTATAYLWSTSSNCTTSFTPR